MVVFQHVCCVALVDLSGRLLFVRRRSRLGYQVVINLELDADIDLIPGSLWFFGRRSGLGAGEVRSRL